MRLKDAQSEYDAWEAKYKSIQAIADPVLFIEAVKEAERDYNSRPHFFNFT